MSELEQHPHTPLLDALLAYPLLKRRRFHVPGHGGQFFWTGQLAEKAHALGFQSHLLQHDLSEVEGLDVLSIPEGVIAESQALTASRCGVSRSFYLINGASVGLHAALLATFQPDELVLMPRNVHRAISAGMVLSGVRPAWFTPTWEEAWGIWGAVTLEQVQDAYEQHPTAKGIVITSPTYEGIVSDLQAIAQWCHTKNLRLIVDEAHGSLFGHVPGTPASATQCHGVDAVIQSFHKTVGSLTQSAVLHLPHGSSLLAVRVQETLNHLQSTSPNYLLLASLDLSSAWLGSLEGQAQRQSLWRNMKALRQRIHGMTAFKLLETPKANADLDKMRLYLRHAYCQGHDWAEALEQNHGLSYELANPYGALFIAQMGHTPPDFVAFMQGLQVLAKLYPKHKHPSFQGDETPFFTPLTSPVLPLVDACLSPRDAFFRTSTQYPVDEKIIGRLSGETIVSCPPGIPVLHRGERLQEGHLPFLSHRDVISLLD